MQATNNTHADNPKRYQCRHIFTDGHRCGSPCLRGEELCYYPIPPACPSRSSSLCL